MKRHYILLFCMSFILLGGICCVRAGSSPFSQKSERPLLSELVHAHAIRIQDDWTGLSPVAPLKAHYALERSANQFNGKGEFSAGGYSKHPQEAVENISIPIDKAESFLQMLSKSPLREGAYEPRIEHTDDYPSIKIELELDNETVVFFTKSQGEGNVPWGVTIKGKTYVIESDTPAKALETIEPYLKYEVLDKLKKGSGRANRESSRALVSIEANWELSLSSTSAVVYQETVPNKDVSGKPIVAQGPAMLPAFLRLPDGTIVPALTRRAAGGIPIRSRHSGTGIVITSDGFILTTRAVAAAWKMPYTWDPKYYGAGAVLFVLDASLRQTRSQFIGPEQLPDNWVPADSTIVDRRRIGGARIEGRSNRIDVIFPTTEFRSAARLARVSDRHDLALIKVDLPEPLEKMSLESDDQTVGTGDSIVAMGYPEVAPRVAAKASIEEDSDKRGKGQPASVITSIGIVSKVSQSPGSETPALYQLTIPPISSGSVVFLENGHLIGLVSTGGKQSNPAFVVPIRYAVELMR